jgi:antitoxin component of MazEF toxin-antitoxin module
MIQKVLKVGSSAAVTIPKKALDELELKIGDSVSLTIDAERRRVVVESPAVVDRELVQWTRAFIKKYRPALEALKDK